jgi:hypothetical protein
MDARDGLENAVLRSNAMLEALAALLEVSEKSEHPRLTAPAVEGLQFIAMEEGINLRERFENYTEMLLKKSCLAA